MLLMGSSVDLTGTRKESIILKTSQPKFPKLIQKEKKKNWKKKLGKKNKNGTKVSKNS